MYGLLRAKRLEMAGSWSGGTLIAGIALSANLLCKEGQDGKEGRQRGPVLNRRQKSVPLTAATIKRAETFVLALRITVLRFPLRLDENLNCTLHNKAKTILLFQEKGFTSRQSSGMHGTS
jgi:hypothetical protein